MDKTFILYRQLSLRPDDARLCYDRPQQTQNIYITFIQCRCINVIHFLCLLGRNVVTHLMNTLCTCRLNWAKRTSSGRLDDWDDTALRTQNSKFEPWRSEVEHATSQSRKLPTILNLYEWAEKKRSVSLKLECQSGVRARDIRLSKQTALTTLPEPPPRCSAADSSNCLLLK